VHPESYPVVRRILGATKSDIKALIGNSEIVRQLKPQAFVDDTVGLPTVTDILRELEKPGRDPRPAFKSAVFKEGVEEIKHLKAGMILEGTVTNVAAFGAFVDVGVHQDGLVHISAMSKSFVKDPREVVKPGDIVKVKVLEVEVARKRIALTLRLDDETNNKKESKRASREDSRASSKRSSPGKPAAQSAGGALADALRRAGAKGKRGNTSR
jgi:protein Tex